MQFDLFTFFASLFNFLVLLLVLRIFLFKRVTRAMDTREERIASTWDEAEKSRGEADELRAEYERRIEEADEERDELLSQAREEIEREKRRRMDEARKEVSRKRDEWLESLRAEQERLVRSVREQVARATVESTRAALSSLADTNLERRMVERLAVELGGRREELSAAASGARVEVTTSEPLDEADRERVRDAVNGVAQPGSIDFDESDDLVCGIRMRIGDREIGWSLADHMGRLQTGIDELVEAR